MFRWLRRRVFCRAGDLPSNEAVSTLRSIMEDTLRPTILQPPLYFFVLWQSAALIDPLQLHLGIAVSVREAGYLITTLACCWANPSFLLVNVAASVREIQTLRPDL
eukprot:COSAG06_NODE_41296_length_393_cov_0.472789_1_plen_105_part_10